MILPASRYVRLGRVTPHNAAATKRGGHFTPLPSLKESGQWSREFDGQNVASGACTRQVYVRSGFYMTRRSPPLISPATFRNRPAPVMTRVPLSSTIRVSNNIASHRPHPPRPTNIIVFGWHAFVAPQPQLSVSKHGEIR
jgi:hypothetical protein